MQGYTVTSSVLDGISSAFKVEYFTEDTKSYTLNKRFCFHFRLNFKMSPIISCLQNAFRRAEVRGGELGRRRKVAFFHSFFSCHSFFHLLSSIHLLLFVFWLPWYSLPWSVPLYVNGQACFRISLRVLTKKK